MTRLLAWLNRRGLLSLTHWNVDSDRRGRVTARVVIDAHRRMPERVVLAFAPHALLRVAGGRDPKPPALVLQSCSWSREPGATWLTWDVAYKVET